EGSLLITADETLTVLPEPVDAVIDATGAGDLYASGVLYGLARGLDLDVCGRLGSIAAAEVISHVGPRPEVSLAELAADLI
ncbi:MAG: PfkB family carbohydrate kinase, partial [Actinomycetota bacterium]|nr:PfkB family carbohydrate kinase [Actinomycetota bacterium]